MNSPTCLSGSAHSVRRSEKVLAVSCITNMATGIQTVKHRHARVLEIANQAGDTMCRWLGAVIQKM